MAKHKIDGAIPKIWQKYFKDTIFLTHEPSDAPTLGEKVETISQQATKRKVRFIVLYTHSHSGLKRLFLGSFAETFLLYSKVPTLVISPYCTAAGGGIKQILFPTDFSEQSLTAFNLVIDMASRLKAKVSVVHYSHTAEHSSLFSEAIFGELEEETKKKLAKIYKAGGQLVVKGMKGKVKTTFCVVSGRGTFDPSGAIKKFAKNKKIDLIGLAAQSGTIKSTFLGATSRELARSAPCPVLICRQ